MLGEAVTLKLTPSVADGYELYVNGENVTQDGGCTITLTGEQTSVSIALHAGDEITEYTLILCASDGCTVRIPVDSADIALQVFDQNGQAVTGSFNEKALIYVFSLVPGQTYTYTATKDTYYHAEGSFTAAFMTLTKVSVPTDTWLSDLSLSKDGATSSKGSIALDQTFQPSVHAYTAVVPDTPPAVYLWIDGDIETAATTFTARYRTITSTSLDDQEKEIPISASQLASPVFMQQLLMNQNGRGNTLTIRCQRAGKSVNYYQDYVITIKRSFSLENLSISCGGVEKVLTHSGGLTGYTPAVWDYIVTVPAAAESLSLCADVYSEDACYRDNGNTGYHVWLGEQELVSSEAVDVALNHTSQAETITLTVKNEFAGDDTASTYQILVQKAEPVLFTPTLQPAGALLFVREHISGLRIWPDEDGTFELSEEPGRIGRCEIDQ